MNNINTLSTKISLLPQEIKNKIYTEYFEPEIFYDKYIFVLYSEASQSLEYTQLRQLLPILLSKKLVIKLLCSNCEIFRDVYTSHKLNKKKCFRKFKNGNSFALEILYCLYH
jgi:hypothetical protein